MPDATLMAAADSDALQVPGTVEAQARRLLGDPRARAAVADFHAQWLQFVRMQGLAKAMHELRELDLTECAVDDDALAALPRSASSSASWLNSSAVPAD